MKCRFLKTMVFSYFECTGLIWFRIFNIGLSFKHINNHDFKNEEKKGLFLGYWVINFIK